MNRGSLFAPQADVQRRRQATANIDLRDVRPVAGLADLDGVRAFCDFDAQAILGRNRRRGGEG